MALYMVQILQLTFKRWLLVSILCLGCSLWAVGAGAQLFAPDACDPEYYESLEARAWLEAQREITQNQNLIFKSDSVLEYTCFDGYLSELADHAKDMFSQSSRWGAPAGDMAAALTNLVAVPMDAYQTSNFDHRLLGGRTVDLIHDLPNTIGPGSYACDRMNEVWRIAKCMDFIDQATYPEGVASDNDGFFTFLEYQEQEDKRFLPTACPKTADFQASIDLATVDDVTVWEEDFVDTYFELIYPENTNDCSTSIAISTGLTVYRNVGQSFSEHVCVVPGCYYEPSDDKCCLHNGGC